MSVMRWFTRDCLTGGLADEEWQLRYDSYAAHLEDLTPQLADGVAALHPSVTNLHDGQPSEWGYVGRTLRLRVLIGDLQQGYEWVEIEYDDAELFPDRIAEDLASWPLSDCEIGADELTVTSDGRMEQRFLLWPEGEFGVRFATCQVRRSPADANDRR